MSETREYFQNKYPEFIADIESRFNFTIGNLPVPTNSGQWLDLVKLVYSGASAAKDASIRDYMNICEDLSRKLEEARGKIGELEARDTGLGNAMMEIVKSTRAYLPPDGISAKDCISRILAVTDNPEMYQILVRAESETLAAKDARIANLEAAIKPFAALYDAKIFDGIPYDALEQHFAEVEVCVADTCRARTVLEGKSNG